MMINEHDRVVLTQDISGNGLCAGDVGTVVHIYKQGEAYEVEFLALDGETMLVATLSAAQVRPVHRSKEILHTRELLPV